MVRQLVTPVLDRELRLRLPLHRQLPPPQARISDVIDAYYVDPSGAEYWANWRDYGEDKFLPQLIANHLAVEEVESGDDEATEEAERKRLALMGRS